MTERPRLRWDATAVSREELGLVRQFMARRETLAPQARTRLASDLAARLRPKVAGGGDLEPEQFLLQLLVERSD